MPTVKPGISLASPLETCSSPAMILMSVDLPVPLGPTTPIFAPGRKLSVTLSRTTLSPCALRTARRLYMNSGIYRFLALVAGQRPATLGTVMAKSGNAVRHGSGGQRQRHPVQV